MFLHAQYEGLVPDGVEGLFLGFCRVNLLVWDGVLHHGFTGFRSGPSCLALLLILQDGQQAVWVTETWGQHITPEDSQTTTARSAVPKRTNLNPELSWPPPDNQSSWSTFDCVHRSEVWRTTDVFSQDALGFLHSGHQTLDWRLWTRLRHRKTEPVEAAEGRTAHNNVWIGANGMASNTWKPWKPMCLMYLIPFYWFRSSHYHSPVVPN